MKNFELDKDIVVEVETKDIQLSISDELKKYRNEFGYKQDELAKRLNVSQVMISKMESGKYNYTIKSLVNLWTKLAKENYNIGRKIVEKILEIVDKDYEIVKEKDKFIINDTYDYDVKIIDINQTTIERQEGA